MKYDLTQIPQWIYIIRLDKTILSLSFRSMVPFLSGLLLKGTPSKKPPVGAGSHERSHVPFLQLTEGTWEIPVRFKSPFEGSHFLSVAMFRGVNLPKEGMRTVEIETFQKRSHTSEGSQAVRSLETRRNQLAGAILGEFPPRWFEVGNVGSFVPVMSSAGLAAENGETPKRASSFYQGQALLGSGPTQLGILGDVYSGDVGDASDVVSSLVDDAAGSAGAGASILTSEERQCIEPSRPAQYCQSRVSCFAR